MCTYSYVQINTLEDMIKRADSMNLTDTYGNKWALELIKKFLDDTQRLDIPVYKAIGPSVIPGSEGMDEFWYTLERAGERYDHEMRDRLEKMMRLPNTHLHVQNESVNANNTFPYNYILWKSFAPLVWYNFKVSKL